MLLQPEDSARLATAAILAINRITDKACNLLCSLRHTGAVPDDDFHNLGSIFNAIRKGIRDRK